MVGSCSSLSPIAREPSARTGPVSGAMTVVLLALVVAVTGTACNERREIISPVRIYDAGGGVTTGRDAGDAPVFVLPDAGPSDAPPCMPNVVSCSAGGFQYCGLIGNGCGARPRLRRLSRRPDLRRRRHARRLRRRARLQARLLRLSRRPFCGKIGDGCGSMLDCGDCPGATVCGGARHPQACAAAAPTARRSTCDSPGGRYCGKIGDGCGKMLDCGNCPARARSAAGPAPQPLRRRRRLQAAHLRRDGRPLLRQHRRRLRQDRSTAALARAARPAAAAAPPTSAARPPRPAPPSPASSPPASTAADRRRLRQDHRLRRLRGIDTCGGAGVASVCGNPAGRCTNLCLRQVELPAGGKTTCDRHGAGAHPAPLRHARSRSTTPWSTSPTRRSSRSRPGVVVRAVRRRQVTGSPLVSTPLRRGRQVPPRERAHRRQHPAGHPARALAPAGGRSPRSSPARPWRCPPS